MSAPRSAPDRTSGDRSPLRPAGPGHRRTGALYVLVAFARASRVRPGRRPWDSAVATSPAETLAASLATSPARGLPASPASVQISPAARAWSGRWHPRCGRFAHVSWLVWREGRGGMGGTAAAGDCGRARSGCAAARPAAPRPPPCIRSWYGGRLPPSLPAESSTTGTTLLPGGSRWDRAGWHPRAGRPAGLQGR